MRIAPLVLAMLLGASEARADGTEMVWFPGASRAIAHSMSASRDTALFGVTYFPYPSGSAGVDFAFLALHSGGWSLRYGLFGMIEVHSVERWGISTTGAWRGLAGGSIAVSADAMAESLLGKRGKLEAALSIRHESEHASDTTRASVPLPKGTTGNFVMPDVAIRVPVSSVDLEFRLQTKVFIPARPPPEYKYGIFFIDGMYAWGPGADAIVRWRVHPHVHPFWSTFAEYLRGIERNANLIDVYQVPGGVVEVPYGSLPIKVPDHYVVRSQIGVILPFDAEPGLRTFSGDLQLFYFVDIGHGVGVLKYQEEVRVGLGARGVVFR